MASNLTLKQQQFCREYLKDFNGSAAALRTGYSPKTAREQAARMLSNVNIQLYIKELTQKLQEKTEISTEKILNELAAIAFCQTTEFLEVQGNNVFVKDSSKWSESAKSAIQSVKQTKDGISISTHSKVGALEKLMMRFGINQPDKAAEAEKVHFMVEFANAPTSEPSQADLSSEPDLDTPSQV